MPLDLFTKSSIEKTVHESLHEVILNLQSTPGQEACLHQAYAILTEKYRGERINTYLRFFDIFIRDTTVLWKKNGFLHCTNMNYLLRILLIKSGHFTEDDIRLRWTLIWYTSPHQYVQVLVNGKWVAVDIWGHDHGVSFGSYAHGFH